MREKISNILIDLAKIMFGAGIIGLVIKDASNDTKYIIGISFFVLFLVLIFLGLIISKEK